MKFAKLNNARSRRRLRAQTRGCRVGYQVDRADLGGGGFGNVVQINEQDDGMARAMLSSAARFYDRAE